VLTCGERSSWGDDGEIGVAGGGIEHALCEVRVALGRGDRAVAEQVVAKLAREPELLEVAAPMPRNPALGRPTVTRSPALDRVLRSRTMSIDELYAAISSLTPQDRLRLVERVVHDVIESSAPEAQPSSLIGMMADEPELMDEVCALAMAAREQSRMRPIDG